MVFDCVTPLSARDAPRRKARTRPAGGWRCATIKAGATAGTFGLIFTRVSRLSKPLA